VRLKHVAEINTTDSTVVLTALYSFKCNGAIKKNAMFSNLEKEKKSPPDKPVFALRGE